MRTLFHVLIVICILGGCSKSSETPVNSDVVVFINSNSPEVVNGTKKVIPYLDHFGVRYRTVDLSKDPVPAKNDNPALVILSHPGITKPDDNRTISSRLERYISHCKKKGTGILSFDPFGPGSLLAGQDIGPAEDQEIGELVFSNEKHYITDFHQPGEKKELFGFMSLPKMKVKEGQAFITGDTYPLLVVSAGKNGNMVQWASQDWMYYSVLGPMGGLDDCLWKSVVWAARKPFVMQALPPLVTMRVDDVFGCDRQQWDKTPFHWVKTANKYGFKPWLGLFIYNVTPEGVEELKELTSMGLATAAPHALGRPPRPVSSRSFMPKYWHPDAIPYLSDSYDEFIFFNHNEKEPWPDETAKKTLKAVDDWYNKVGPLPMSNYLIPHFYEMGTNVLSHVHDNWNIQFILSTLMPDKPFSGHDYSQMPLRGPFRSFEEPIVGKPKQNALISRSYYFADFVKLAGRNFFMAGTEIRDIAGYEWSPDNDIESTAQRGIETIRRSMEAKALAVLFTHETDYIYRITPENWDAIFQKVNEGISNYNPILTTTDEALKIVRAFHTSEIESGEYNRSSGELSVKLKGKADVPTSIYIYTGKQENIVEKRIEIPPFENGRSELIQLDGL